jgi:tetratricopeptide (TPR) repeat protein
MNKKVIISVLTLLVCSVSIFCQEKNDSIYQALYQQGVKYKNQYQFVQAAHVFEKAFSIDTANIDLLLSLGETYLVLNNKQKALEVYDRVFALDSTNILAYINLGDFYQQKENYQVAITYYLPIITKIDTLNYYAYKQLGLCYSFVNEAKAYYYFNKARIINPADIYINVKMGNILITSKKYDQAIKICDEGLQQDSSSLTLQSIKAFAYYNKGEFEKVIVLFNKVLENGGDTSVFIAKNLGYSYFFLGEMKECHKYLDISINKNANSYDCYIYNAMACLQLGQPDLSLFNLYQADSMKYPGNDYQSRIYAEMGNVFNTKRDYVNGTKYLELSYKVDKEKFEVAYSLATQYEYLKRKQEAIRLYKEIVNKAPSKYATEISLAKARLKKLNISDTAL